MAYSEMDYMNRGGGRTPIKIASTTATSGANVTDVIEALKTNAGTKLTNALNENWNTLTLKINDKYVFKLVYIADDANYCVFSYSITASTQVGYSVSIYFNSISHALRHFTGSSSGNTIEALTTIASASPFIGEWALYV